MSRAPSELRRWRRGGSGTILAIRREEANGERVELTTGSVFNSECSSIRISKGQDVDRFGDCGVSDTLLGPEHARDDRLKAGR